MSEKIFEIFEKRIENLKLQNLYRSVKDIDSREGMKIIIKGKKFVNFASNDYLGLSQHPVIKHSAIEAIKLFGVGSGASRLLSGGTILHKKLEELLSKFKNSQEALIFNSGYTANLSAIQSIAQEGDLIFSDELNHASLIDGCRLSKAEKYIYKHCNMDDLYTLLKRVKGRGKKIVITDTVFSMDGDIAPIKELYEICKSQEALLYLDDAHGTGVLGKGFGALKHFGLKTEDFVIQMGTFSKALGSFGAFICGSSTIIDWLRNSSRGFIFSTALPVSVIASSYSALKLLLEDNSLVKKLWENTNKVKETIKKLDLSTTPSQTPIIPILFKELEMAIKASKRLEELNIYAPVIKPPTVKIPRIRLTVTAAHTEEEIETLIEALGRL